MFQNCSKNAVAVALRWRCSCSYSQYREMEIEEAKFVTLADQVTSTRISLHSGAIPKTRPWKEPGSGKQMTQGTQTAGHVFMGKAGEVIITTNYTLVELVLNQQAVEQLTDCRTDGHQLNDTVIQSLARLDWNGEQILENAMTLVRLTLTRNLMPQLVREVANTLKTELEHHKVQHLAERLFDQHMAKLFGIDVSSLVFILEHCSVDDAVTTCTSKEKQEALQRILLSFLPEWMAQCAAVSVAFYTLSPADRAHYYGFDDPVTLSFLVGTWRRPESPHAPSAGSSVSPGSKTGGYIKREADLGLPSTEAQELGVKQSRQERSSQYTTVEKTQATTEAAASASTRGVPSQLVKEVSSGTSSAQAASVSESTAAVSGDRPMLTAASERSGFAGRHRKADESLHHSGDVPRRGWAESVHRERQLSRRDRQMPFKSKKACWSCDWLLHSTC